MTQQNHQVVGIQQGHMQVGFQNQTSAVQPMNLAQQMGGPQVMANMMFARDLYPKDMWKHISRWQKFNLYIGKMPMPIGPIR